MILSVLSVFSCFYFCTFSASPTSDIIKPRVALQFMLSLSKYLPWAMGSPKPMEWWYGCKFYWRKLTWLLGFIIPIHEIGHKGWSLFRRCIFKPIAITCDDAIWTSFILTSMNHIFSAPRCWLSSHERPSPQPRPQSCRKAIESRSDRM